MMKTHLFKVLADQDKAIRVLETMLKNSSDMTERSQQARLAVKNLRSTHSTIRELADNDKVGGWLLLKSAERINNEVTFGEPLGSSLMQEQVDSFNEVFAKMDEFYKEFLDNYKSNEE